MVSLPLGFLGVRGHRDGSESEFLDHPTLPEGTHSTNCRAATHLKRGGVCCADGGWVWFRSCGQGLVRGGFEFDGCQMIQGSLVVLVLVLVGLLDSGQDCDVWLLAGGLMYSVRVLVRGE